MKKARQPSLCTPPRIQLTVLPEQETLISTLRTRDQSTNTLYKTAFLALPLLSTLVYLPLIFTSSTSASTSSHPFLLSLLSITSLLSTAYTLHFIPLTTPDTKGKTPLYRLEPGSPVTTYLPYLNGGLSALLTLIALLAWRRERVEEAWRGVLPGVVFAVVMFARREMGVVSREVGGLERLRYGYKGA